MDLLAPARARGGTRQYSTEDLCRVAVILQAKEAGLGLTEIRTLVEAGDATSRRALLARHRAELAERIAGLQASLELVDCALDCEHDDLATCPQFQRAIAERAGLTDHVPAEHGRG
jgi:DNA-binding transcriptional MerR regulator